MKGVAELMPPVLADDLALVHLIDAPEFRVAVFVEEDGVGRRGFSKSTFSGN